MGSLGHVLCNTYYVLNGDDEDLMRNEDSNYVLTRLWGPNFQLWAN